MPRHLQASKQTRAPDGRLFPLPCVKYISLCRRRRPSPRSDDPSVAAAIQRRQERSSSLPVPCVKYILRRRGNDLRVGA